MRLAPIGFIARALLLLGMPLLAIALMSRILALDPGEAAIRIDDAKLIVGNLEEASMKAGGEVRTLPHDWRGDIDARAAWYHFDLPLRVAPDRLWAIWLPRVSMNAAVYLNGELIGQAGRMRSPVTRDRYRPRYFLLPNGVLGPGQNHFAIQVVSEPGGNGFLREIYLGPAHEIEPFARAHALLSVTAVQAIVAALFLTAALMALLWLFRRQDALFGSYAAMLFTWAVHDLYYVVDSPHVPVVLLDWLWHASLCWFVVSVCLFVLRFVGERRPVAERVVLFGTVVHALMLAAVAAFAPSSFYGSVAPASDTVALALSVWPFWRMLKRYFLDGAPSSGALLTAGATTWFFAFHDWMVVTGVLDARTGYLLPYSAVGVMIVFGTILVRRFGIALADLETLNRELELRVSAKEREIRRGYELMRGLERSRAIAAERERLMRDMHDGIGGTLITALAMVESEHFTSRGVADALRASIEDLRLMIDSFEPVEGDLACVLGMLRSRMEPRLSAIGLRLEWAVGDLPALADFGPQKVLHVMRILQEAVNNVIKHADATIIRVETGIDARTGAHWVAVSDDGVGPGDANLAGNAGPGVMVSPSRGLTNMRRRATEIGGEVSVLERPGGGTSVLLRLGA
ncbi:MAG: 7TM diverse intracellular signaling domain-containing protein [Burkholderiaceae bacterium]